MPHGARLRSETNEIVFFKKTLLFHRERVKKKFFFPLKKIKKDIGAPILLQINDPNGVCLLEHG